MAQLNILGAQRVKALIAMLKEKEQQEILTAQRAQVSHDEASIIVHEQMGITEPIEEIEQMKERIDELNKVFRNTVGMYYTLNKNYSYNSLESSRYLNRIKEIQQGDTQQQIKEIQRVYKHKEQQLWLCETLEDAKAIVGI